MTEYKPTPERQQEILEEVSDALSSQFTHYSWSNMIDDGLDERFTPEEKAWAKEYISYKAYIAEIGIDTGNTLSYDCASTWEMGDGTLLHCLLKPQEHLSSTGAPSCWHKCGKFDWWEAIEPA